MIFGYLGRLLFGGGSPKPPDPPNVPGADEEIAIDFIDQGLILQVYNSDIIVDMTNDSNALIIAIKD